MDEICHLVLSCAFTLSLALFLQNKLHRASEHFAFTFRIGEHFHSATKHCLQHCVRLGRQCCNRCVKQMTTNIQFNILRWISIDYGFLITRHCTPISFESGFVKLTRMYLFVFFYSWWLQLGLSVFGSQRCWINFTKPIHTTIATICQQLLVAKLRFFWLF